MKLIKKQLANLGEKDLHRRNNCLGHQPWKLPPASNDPTSSKSSRAVTQMASPCHIMIHTGYKNPKAQQERVATSLRGAMEKVSSNFPTDNIMMSTLLQRRDTHSVTIQWINASL
jgi:hypothetical protein